MTTALALLGYAGLLGLFGPQLVDRARWAMAAPRLAIATWFALAASFVLALALAGMAIVMPMEIFTGGPVGLVQECIAVLREQYGEIGGFALVVLAAVLTWAVPIRLLFAAIAALRSAAVDRSKLRRELAVARRNGDLGAVVVGCSRPAAYCIPGKGGLIVITSGALELLDGPQIEAVLAHERAHLAGHHHLLVAFAQAGRRAFGWLPLFAHLPERIGQLVELTADDAAARSATRNTLARSLLNVAAAQVPVEALAASGG
ncbi:M56 family metallopeptidase, partial [Glycomyces tenuis]